MALLQVNFFSNSLMRTVTVQAIIPADKRNFDGKLLREKKPFKTLYLLHGLLGDDTDWIGGTRIQRWAQDQNLAVIMPAGENHFYVDSENSGEKYGEFIGKELVEFTRDLFPLSDKREDTFIAGLSMGGYGAIRNGLKYQDTFSHIAGLSSGFIQEGVLASKENDSFFTGSRKFYTSVFGNLENLEGSDKDYKALIGNLKEKGLEIPRIYLCCGTEDFLLQANRDYRDFLQKEEIDFTYEEGSGSHDWDFWDTYIKRVLDWLPLENAAQGISSGNVH